MAPARDGPSQCRCTDSELEKPCVRKRERVGREQGEILNALRLWRNGSRRWLHPLLQKQPLKQPLLLQLPLQQPLLQQLPLQQLPLQQPLLQQLPLQQPLLLQQPLQQAVAATVIAAAGRAAAVIAAAVIAAAVIAAAGLSRQSSSRYCSSCHCSSHYRMAEKQPLQQPLLHQKPVIAPVRIAVNISPLLQHPQGLQVRPAFFDGLFKLQKKAGLLRAGPEVEHDCGRAPAAAHDHDRVTASRA